MKAMTIEKFGSAETLKLTDVPTPHPKEDEVQIEVLFTAVNPVDWKIREGYLKNRIPHEFPIILGWDASGVVTAVGKNVKNFKVGDEVFTYCRKPTIQWGTYAEYVCVNAHNTAHKPKNITFAQAASIPLVALTAWQSLFDAAQLKRGESILIHAGAGGVGSLAIQFAKNAGAKVYTTASEKNHSYVKKLGADEVIDYSKGGFLSQMKKLTPEGVDVIFDMIGGDTLKESLQLLKPKGRLVSIVEQLDPALADKHQIEFSYVFVSPNGSQLSQIATQIAQNKIAVPTIQEMPLSEARQAQEKIRGGHIQGKIVLKVK
jgi:NADPH2:quinone reductase